MDSTAPDPGDKAISQHAIKKAHHVCTSMPHLPCRRHTALPQQCTKAAHLTPAPHGVLAPRATRARAQLNAAASAAHCPRATLPAMIFNPSQADVRRFFCSVRAKMKSESPMEAIETLASLWIAEHPEYFAELDDVDAAVARNYDAEPGRTNPFLHLSMHLSISEQCSVDSPRGIRQAVELLARKRDLHDAHHEVMECLGTMLWESQRSGRPPDGNAYVAAVQRRATQD